MSVFEGATKNFACGIGDDDVNRNDGAVGTVQAMLNQFWGARIAVDGIFGPQTQSAVIGFQRANDLVADGYVGPETSAALQDDASAPIGGTRKLPVAVTAKKSHGALIAGAVIGTPVIAYGGYKLAKHLGWL